MDGLSVSRDAGRTWRTSSDGMPDGFLVYGVLPHGDRILVCGSDGVLESRDGGANLVVGDVGKAEGDRVGHVLMAPETRRSPRSARGSSRRCA